MKAFILALFVISAFASTARYGELKLVWDSWKSVHDKVYSEGEDSARFAIFLNNLKFIEEYNAADNTAKMGLNKFSDLTNEEFKLMYGGCAFTQETEEEYYEIDDTFFDVAAIVDWRDKGAVTPIKDQGQCGSCWTFSATGVAEGYYQIKGNALTSFSEQQIVDCAKQAGQGCSGGWPDKAIQYAASEGLETESDYPYTAEDGSCKYNSGKAIKSVTGAVPVLTKSVTALQAAITLMPTSVVIEADQAVFQNYKSGVLSSGCGAGIDHAVLAVGYDATSFIVKNSWGTSWGNKGYVQISNNASANGGKGVCGILSGPTIAK